MHLCLLMASEPVPASADAARQLAAALQRRMRGTVPLAADMLAVTVAPLIAFFVVLFMVGSTCAFRSCFAARACPRYLERAGRQP